MASILDILNRACFIILCILIFNLFQKRSWKALFPHQKLFLDFTLNFLHESWLKDSSMSSLRNRPALRHWRVSRQRITRLKTRDTSEWTRSKGLCVKKIPQSQDNYGSGWVGPHLTRIKNIIGKSSHFTPACLCVFCFACMSLNVVRHYDLSGLSWSVMGFQKKFG